MKRLSVFGLTVLLALPGAALAGDGEAQLAWQMGTTERGYTENFDERSLAEPNQGLERGSPFGPGVQSEPYGPGSTMPGDDDSLRRQPNLGGSDGGPYYRPWTGRGCRATGGGRTCF